MHSPRAEGGDEPEPQREARAQNGSAAAGPLALHRNGNGWVVPQAAIDRALAQANSVEAMKELHAGIAALQKAAEELEVAFEQLLAIAVNRIRVERKIGTLLSQLVHRGGDRANSHCASLLGAQKDGRLPKDVNWSKSARYQRLAAVPEDAVATYFTEMTAKKRVPSSNGLLLRASKKSPRKRPRAARQASAEEPPSPSPAILDAVQRLMDVDVCVGEVGKALRTGRVMNPSQAKPKQLAGCVFVAACSAPAEWLPALCRKDVQEAVVVLPCSPGSDWFQAIEDGRWLCCFTRGAASPAVIAYRGQRKHAFWLAFHEMGAILHAGITIDRRQRRPADFVPEPKFWNRLPKGHEMASVV